MNNLFHLPVLDLGNYCMLHCSYLGPHSQYRTIHVWHVLDTHQLWQWSPGHRGNISGYLVMLLQLNCWRCFYFLSGSWSHCWHQPLLWRTPFLIFGTSWLFGFETIQRDAHRVHIMHFWTQGLFVSSSSLSSFGSAGCFRIFHVGESEQKKELPFMWTSWVN